MAWTALKRTRSLERHKLHCLPDDEIHLWFTFPDETEEPAKPFSAETILDDEERAREQRLHSPGSRRLFQASHSLVRKALSRYASIPPAKWRFVKNVHGKPRIDPNLGSIPLSFSLSHTKGLAVVAVAAGADVGVDVESMDRRVDAAKISGRFFSPEESVPLQKCRPGRLREHFFRYWTLKECYMKARGLGLSLPLDSFSFRLAEGLPHRIVFSEKDLRNSEDWRFALIRTLRYVAAIAVKTGRPGPLRIRCFQLMPGEKAIPLKVERVGLSPGMEIQYPASRIEVTEEETFLEKREI